jgi:hypothetical protein
MTPVPLRKQPAQVLSVHSRSGPGQRGTDQRRERGDARRRVATPDGHSRRGVPTSRCSTSRASGVAETLVDVAAGGALPATPEPPEQPTTTNTRNHGTTFLPRGCPLASINAADERCEQHPCEISIGR